MGANSLALTYQNSWISNSTQMLFRQPIPMVSHIKWAGIFLLHRAATRGRDPELKHAPFQFPQHALGLHLVHVIFLENTVKKYHFKNVRPNATNTQNMCHNNGWYSILFFCNFSVGWWKILFKRNIKKRTLLNLFSPPQKSTPDLILLHLQKLSFHNTAIKNGRTSRTFYVWNSHNLKPQIHSQGRAQ